jgi:hypothetical protein
MFGKNCVFLLDYIFNRSFYATLNDIKVAYMESKMWKEMVVAYSDVGWMDQE